MGQSGLSDLMFYLSFAQDKVYLYSFSKQCLSKFWGSVVELLGGGRPSRGPPHTPSSVIYLAPVCLGTLNNISVVKRILHLNKVRKSH